MKGKKYKFIVAHGEISNVTAIGTIVDKVYVPFSNGGSNPTAVTGYVIKTTDGDIETVYPTDLLCEIED